MNIFMVSSEAVPYVQTGGLGDVVGTLSLALAQQNHSVSLVLPFYKTIRHNLSHHRLTALKQSLPVKMGDRMLHSRVWTVKKSDRFRLYFIEYDEFFNRKDLYGEDGGAYGDNCRRFSFFSKAALDLAVQRKIKPDIIHVNDWQTALIAYYLKTWFWSEPVFQNSASVLTIHNMGYQGQFAMENSAFIGLNWMQVRSDEFEDHEGLNLLKGGIFYADTITTVSPTYAKEILTEPGGCGLSSYLARRRNDVAGILNGIDEQEWNCKADRYLPQTYSKDDLTGKQACKQSLQKRFGLKTDPKTPIFGMIGRLAHQKGLQLLMGCAEKILSWDLQLVVLGSGSPYYAGFFENLATYFGDRVGIYIGFENELSHLIEAGSDFFIMPSLYEPCGLNQIYSMLYGTLPIVRATGGLADTVQNFDEEKLTGTGFVFNDATDDALQNTIGWALSTWYNNRKAYQTLQQSAMNQNFGWNKAVKAYQAVYTKAVARRQNWS